MRCRFAACAFVIALWTLNVAVARAETVAYWRFEEGNGSTAVDSSGYGNNATINQGNLYSSDVAFSPIPATGAQNSHSVKFNGTGQFAIAADSPTLRPTTSITMEAIVKLSSDIVDNAGIIARQLSTGSADSFNLGLRGADNYPFVSIQLGGVSKVVDLTEALEVGQWYSLVGTWDGGTLKLFVNAELKGSTAAVGTISYPLSNPVIIGADNEASGNLEWFFPGWIDEVRISNAVLEPTSFLAAPEPSTFIIAAAGFLGCLVFRRMQRCGGRSLTLIHLK